VASTMFFLKCLTWRFALIKYFWQVMSFQNEQFWCYKCCFKIFISFFFEQSSTTLSFQHRENQSSIELIQCSHFRLLQCLFLKSPCQRKQWRFYLSSSTIISFQFTENIYTVAWTQDNLYGSVTFFLLVSSPKQIMFVLSMFYHH
jgi:hypothetical protein